MVFHDSIKRDLRRTSVIYYPAARCGRVGRGGMIDLYGGEKRSPAKKPSYRR